MMDFLIFQEDLAIANGDICLCPNPQTALVQAINIKLKTLYGEWFLNTTIGIPYLSEIFGQKRSERFIKHIFLKELKSFDSIANINNFEFNIDTKRIAHISFTIILTDKTNLKISTKLEV